MLSLKSLPILGLIAVASAQGQFNQPENSADVLASLQTTNQDTITSGVAAGQYTPGNDTTLTNDNIFLRADWQNVIFTAQSAVGFYTESGAQAIIDYINSDLYPSTKDANAIYASQKPVFVESGFISFINNGLLQLRTAVDAASAAVQAKAPADKLTQITVAFTLIEQSYADVQEFMQSSTAPTGYGA